MKNSDYSLVIMFRFSSRSEFYNLAFKLRQFFIEEPLPIYLAKINIEYLGLLSSFFPRSQIFLIENTECTADFIDLLDKNEIDKFVAFFSSRDYEKFSFSPSLPTNDYIFIPAIMKNQSPPWIISSLNNLKNASVNLDLHADLGLRNHAIKKGSCNYDQYKWYRLRYLGKLLLFLKGRKNSNQGKFSRFVFRSIEYWKHVFSKPDVEFLKLRARDIRFLKSDVIEPPTNSYEVSIPILIYSHSEYSDCWTIIVNSFQKFLSPECSIFILADNSEKSRSEAKKFVGAVELIEYKSSQKYVDRLDLGLSNLMSRGISYVYFVHEDMPLYRSANRNYLDFIVRYMNYEQIEYIKLVDTVNVNSKNSSDIFGLVENVGGYSLSIQPCILNVSLFKNFLGGYKGLSAVDFELGLRTDPNIKALAVHSQPIFVGRGALVSESLFPHIVTAVVKGKWAMKEWGWILQDILVEENIDPECRGCD